MRAVLEIRAEPAYRRTAFEKGLARVGFKIGPLSRPESPSDWLVLWGKKRGTDEQRADAWERLGGSVVVCENGYLAKTDKVYYAISVHGHNGSGWFPVGDEDRFAKLGMPVKPWRRGGSEVIVRAQRGIGSTLMASPPGWDRKMADQLRRITKLPVRVIPHPGDKNKYTLDAAALKHAESCVIWSSALGVRALVEGIPVVYAAPHWICESAAVRQWAHAGEQAQESNRESALHRMAFGQWSFDEIATGEPFARIIAHRGEAVW